MEKMQHTLEQTLATKIFGCTPESSASPLPCPASPCAASPCAASPPLGHKLDEELLQKIAKVRAAAEGAALERVREQAADAPSTVERTGAPPRALQGKVVG